MSEFLAEAEVLIRPNTVGFRALLETQVASAIATAKIPPVTVPVVTAPGAVAGITAVTRTSQELAGADKTRALQAKLTAQAEKELAVATAARARAQSFAARGAGATALSLAGVRGATLAANSSFLVGAAGAVAFFKSLQLAVGLERQLSVFRVTANATSEEMERMAATARALGRDITLPGVTANDAAQSMLEFAKAGLTVDDAITGARGALQLGTAAQIEFADSTILIANALNSFSLEGEEATRVADLLTGAANSAQGSIADMGIALRQSAGAASQIGLSVEDTVVLLTALAKAGLGGSDAGTTLRVALLRLVAPTKDAADVLERFNINLRNAQGGVRVEALFELEEALKGVSRAEADRARVAVFGQNAFRVSALLGRQSIADVDRLRDAITEQGLAAEQSAAQMVGLGGSTENLKNQAADAGITIGNLAKGPLKILVDALALDIKFLNAAAEGTIGFISKIEELGDRIPGADKGLIDYTRSVGEYLDESTRGIPIIDGFFDTLDDGSKKAEDAASIFDKLTVSVTATLDALAKGFKQVGRETPAALPATTANTLARDIAVTQALGDQNRELELLRQREENQSEFLRRILALPDTKANVRTAEKAAQQLELTRAQIQTILDQRASSLEKQAADAERAATDAESARARADAAFLDALLGKRARATDLILRAEGTKSLQDDIKLTESFSDILRQQIEQVKKRVKAGLTSITELRALTTLLIQTTSEIKRLREEQAAILRDAASTRLDTAQRSVELDIELADINDATNKRIQLRLKLIAQLKKERRVLKLTGNELKENRNEIARINAEIAAIKGETDKTKDGFAGLAFDFLQKQQGFATNLLGNLIPGFAAGGLVGGSQGQAENIVSPAAALQAQAGAGKVAGPTFGQAATEVDILRDIARTLKLIQSGRAHPEAGFQRAMGSAVMDGIGGGGGGGQSVS